MHFVYHGDSGNHEGSEILTAGRGTLRAPSPTGSSHCMERNMATSFINSTSDHTQPRLISEVTEGGNL